MKRETTIIAENGTQELFIIREFDAPREMVFRAFTDPAIFVRFFSPFDVTLQLHRFDCRTGGSYSWSHFKGDKKVCTFEGVNHDVTAPLRIIQTSEFMDIPERGNVVLVIMTFEALEGDRTRLTIHDICPNRATRDAIVNSGMEKGLTEIFQKLDQLLAPALQQ
jgi:uncharacterized protein YndB with AHSA1/START domain